MNVKFLRKIRKRFDWYKSTTGQFILIDHERKTATTVDAERLKNAYGNFPDAEINETSLFRFLKVLITKPFMPDYLGRVGYNFAMRRFKTRRK